MRTSYKEFQYPEPNLKQARAACSKNEKNKITFGAQSAHSLDMSAFSLFLENLGLIPRLVP